MSSPLLLLDWGNSQLKGMLIDPQQENWQQVPKVFAHIEDLAAFIKSTAVTELAVASVRDDADNRRLQHIAERQGCKMFFASTQPCFDGFYCRYAQPERMGVDRWLALLAVKDEAASGAVLDIGTAITLDVYADSRHLGGQIAPGLALMEKSLQRTGRVRWTASSQDEIDFLGHSTESCVQAGINSTLAGYLCFLVKSVEAQYRIEHWWLCGGGAVYWRSRLPFSKPVHVDPLLVFKGLYRCYLQSVIQ